MHFSLPLLLAALSAVASAQNPFTFTTTPVVVAGTPFNITWAPSTGTVDTVTLVLRQGDPAHLVDVATIAAGIVNTGSYLWTPPTTLVKGSGYAFEILDDLNKYLVNYSGQFSIDSKNTASSASPATTSGSAAGAGTGASTTATGPAKTTGTGTAAAGTGTSQSTSGTATSASAAATATKNAGVEHVRGGAAMLFVVGAIMAAL